MKKVPCKPAVGADVEVFVSPLGSPQQEIVPCVGHIRGTKDAPWTPPDMPDGYALQEDNVMCEFNIPPIYLRETIYQTILLAREMVRRELQYVKLLPNWEKVSHEFTPQQLASPQAQRIGCDPDYDAYEGGIMRKNPPKLTNWRSCGGHIHLGGNFNCPDFVAALFAELMITVGLGATVHNPLKQTARDSWYGKPGIFRPKPYGIEYRTPSNRWMRDEYYATQVLTRARDVSEFLTTRQAIDLQAMFRQIEWTKVRDYVLGKTMSTVLGKQKLRNQILSQARTAGVPI